MLTILKSFLKDALPLLLYAGVFYVALTSVTRNATRALYLLLATVPLPTIWYKLHHLPFGRDIPDILLLCALLGVIANRGGFDRAPQTFLVGSFAIFSYFALWNSSLRFGLPPPISMANPLAGDWKNYVQLMVLYFVAFSAVREESDVRRAVDVMCLVFLLICVREAKNFSAGGSFSYDNRAAGPFWIVGLGANHFGAFVVHSAALFLGLALVDSSDRRRRWLYAAAAGSAIWPLFFSYSRGAYAAAFLVIVAFGLLARRWLLIVAVTLALSWQFVLPATVVDRITMTHVENGAVTEASAAHRLVLWDLAISLFKSNPIAGIGFGGFAYSVPAGELTDTHNFYVKTAAEQGLLGLALFGAILLTAMWSGYRLFRSGATPFQRGLGLGFLGCMLSVAVTNMFGDRWSYFVLGVSLWTCRALVARASVLARESAAQTSAVEPLRGDIVPDSRRGGGATGALDSDGPPKIITSSGAKGRAASATAVRRTLQWRRRL